MKLLIRLDDITQGTNWDNFNVLENIFDRYNIKPIIGVVPDNKDKEIENKSYVTNKDNFFQRIRNLQEKNYIIAMHGVNHKLKKTFKKSVIDINNYGELVDLNYNEKLNNLKLAKKILQKENIKTNIYMPPAHWIDTEIIDILKKLNFKYITDGLFLYPKKINNIWFAPQQLWSAKNIELDGIWTICLHINEMSQNQIQNIVSFIETNHRKFIYFDDIEFEKYDNLYYQFKNFIFEILFTLALKIKRLKK